MLLHYIRANMSCECLLSVSSRCSLSLLAVLMLAVGALSGSIEQMQCQHTDAMDDVITGVHQPSSSSSHVHKRAANQNLRISVHYDSTFTTGLPSDLRTRLQNTVIPKMTAFFEQALRVRSLEGPILLDRRCDGSFFLPTNPIRRCVTRCEPVNMCGPATVPDAHLKACTECQGSFSTCQTIGSDGPGVANVEFVLYVSAVQTGSCGGSTLAFAGSCEMEDMYDRPIAGFTNFCPNGISADSSDDYILSVAKHELLHALGFSSGLYRYWRDENGNPRTARDENNQPVQVPSGVFGANLTTVRTVTYTDWQTRSGPVTHTVTQLVTPKIVAEGRRHFNCPTLEGVEVENQGGSGTMGSHWELRIVENEVMTGIISTNSVFSRLTFALLEDSGWYTVDYSMAQQLVWGRNSGCGLPTGSCGGYIQSRLQQNAPIAPYCNRLRIDSATGCSNDRLARSACNLVDQGFVLPQEYQYFNSGENFNSASTAVMMIGGSVTIGDYCPYQSSFSNGACSDPTNSQGTGTSNIFGETYAQGSRCFNHPGRWNVTNLSTGSTFLATGSGPRSGCYQYRCSNGQVIVNVQGMEFTCTAAGQELGIDVTASNFRYRGTIICPSCLEICYDDFANCPQAASVYSEFVPATTASVAAPVPVSSTVRLSSTLVPPAPASTTIATAPESSPGAPPPPSTSLILSPSVTPSSSSVPSNTPTSSITITSSSTPSPSISPLQTSTPPVPPPVPSSTPPVPSSTPPVPSSTPPVPSSTPPVPSSTPPVALSTPLVASSPTLSSSFSSPFTSSFLPVQVATSSPSQPRPSSIRVGVMPSSTQVSVDPSPTDDGPSVSPTMEMESGDGGEETTEPSGVSSIFSTSITTLMIIIFATATKLFIV